MSGAAGREIVNPTLKNSAPVDFFLKYNNQAENADRLCKTVLGITAIGKLKSDNANYGKVENFFDTARTVVSLSRTPGLVVKFFTGSAFTHYVERPVVTERRTFVVTDLASGATRNEERDVFVVHTGDGKKIDVPQELRPKTPPGGLIHQNYSMIVEERRDWLDIAMDVFLLVARVLNPIMWLHRMGIADLGKHASRIGTTICCCFSAVTTLAFVQTIRDLIDGVEEAIELPKLKKKVADFISGLIDMLSIPFDCGMAFSSTPELALASACMGVASGALWLGKEIVMG